MELLHEEEFWIAIAFLAACVVLWRQAKGQIIGALDARAQRIREQLDEARKLREDAETALGAYQRKQRDALTEAQEIVTYAQAEAERVAQQAAIDLEAAIKRREAQAHDRIAQAEAKALAEVRAIAVTVAIDAVRVLLTESLDTARGAALIDQAIADLPRRLH
jgi:F-type H+-transporting ATPase subunit b